MAVTEANQVAQGNSSGTVASTGNLQILNATVNVDGKEHWFVRVQYQTGNGEWKTIPNVMLSRANQSQGVQFMLKEGLTMRTYAYINGSDLTIEID